MHSRLFVLFLFTLLLTRTTALAENFTAPQSWCLGRYTLALPTAFALVEHTGNLPAVGLASLGPAGPNTLSEAIEARRNTLATGGETQDATLLLKDTYETAAGTVLVADRRFPELGYTSEVWQEELFLVRDGQLLQLTTLMSTDNAAAARAERDTVAAAVSPLSTHTTPPSGVCLPGFLLALPRISGAWSMTFQPAGVADPVGLHITIVERDPTLPDLAPSLSFHSTDAEPITLAGIPGQAVRTVDTGIHFRAIAITVPDPSGWSVEIVATYFDQRPGAGSDPAAQNMANAAWTALLASLQPR